MAEITVPVRKFLRILDYARRIELDDVELAKAAGLSVERLSEQPDEEPLPAQHYSRLYKELVLRMLEMKQPLPWAAGVGSESFELMCYCIIGSKTLGEALDLATRFDNLVYPMTRYNIRLLRDGDSARISYRVRFSEEESPLVPEEWDRAGMQDTVAKASGLVIWHALCGWLVGQPLETDLVRIEAPYLTDSYARGLEGVFRCPVEFDAQENTMRFSADQLERRVVQTNDSLREFLDNAIYALIAVDREPASTSEAIKSLIVIDLPDKMPSFTHISRQLHMSESSLRRRLQKESTTYQALKDEVRCRVAIDKLLNENIKVADLAEYLGFTEPSSFVRSFKGWTGDTPNGYRERMIEMGRA